MISSDYVGVRYLDSTILQIESNTKGSAAFITSIGRGEDMYLTRNVPIPNFNLQWFRFNEGGQAMFSAGTGPYISPGAGIIVRANTKVPIVSGYRNVYSSKGELVWSAVSAALTPRVIGFFDIPAGIDIDNGRVYSQNIGTGRFILSSMSPGNISAGDGEASPAAWSGLLFRFSGGVLSTTWVTKYQNSWAGTLKPYGLRIPYAIFPNLN
ncbi:hypothetical protein FVB43_20955 [Erwinia rhapontici]|uniref:hypothetical protein n=1 Tax=Erwinia rhapontici TaxID=55212 RepID=UPI0014382C78|nr:hypothetical protein [Erwinia rhapontici]NKG32505.1 hypothetical protein [Erwinia rhapontici]